MRDDQLREEGPPKKYDNTIATTFEQCPRKFYWWRRGFSYAGNSKPPFFTFGSAWGVFQGGWHDSLGPHSSPDSADFSDARELAIAKALLYWDLSGTEGFKKDSRENLEALCHLYTQNYTQEPWRMVKGGAEKGFLFPLEGTPYYLGGSLDGQLEWDGIGALFKEDKTTGIYLNDKYLRQWEFSNQVKGYAWYGDKLYGEGFFGILMDLASKNITKSGKTPQFERKLVQKTPRQHREFEADWLARIHRIEDAYENWHFPMTTDPINCTGGIGKSQCLYQSVCLAEVPFQDLNPAQFPGIEEKDEEWAPWDWEDPAKELEEMMKASQGEGGSDATII